MNPLELATELVRELRARGVDSNLGAAVSYGHKVAVTLESGLPGGNVVVYVGKRGPKRVDTELREPSNELLAALDEAWRSVLALQAPTAAGGPDAPPPSPPEPTVDRATDEMLRYVSRLSDLASRSATYSTRHELDWDGLVRAIEEVAAKLGVSGYPDFRQPGGAIDLDALASLAKHLADDLKAQRGGSTVGSRGSHSRE